MPVETVTVGGIELTVLVADEPHEQRRGLSGMEELPLDGMLFVFGDGESHTFSMEDTLIPLDIWWFSDSGELLGWSEMPLCEEGSCPSYRSPGPIGWALETPAGEYRFEIGATLTTG
ncbi:MAG: DUF192 domain-containing protein [Acidimicrobiia bacterium]|nr:DUF192 domain-containing protein [Acidimicrobiia bacterium]